MAHTVYNVIDTRQSYLQDVVVAGLNALWDSTSRPTTPFTSPTKWSRSRPAAAPILASSLSVEDAQAPYVEVSGRKGLGVKADDLMDKLIETRHVRGGIAPSRRQSGRTAKRSPLKSPWARSVISC